MAIRVTMLNEGGVLDSDTVRNGAQAATAMIEMIYATGALQAGDRFVVDEIEEEAIMSLTKGPLDVVPGPDRPAREDSGKNYGGGLTPEEAIDELAKILHWKWEHVDPSDPIETWAELTDHEKECYRLCIKALIWRGGKLFRIAEHYCRLPETT